MKSMFLTFLILLAIVSISQAQVHIEIYGDSLKNVAMYDKEEQVGSWFSLPVELIISASQIFSGFIELSYDPEILTLGSVTSGTITASFSTNENELSAGSYLFWDDDKEVGVCRIIFALAEPLSQNGTIAELGFFISPSASSRTNIAVNIEQLRLNGIDMLRSEIDDIIRFDHQQGLKNLSALENEKDYSYRKFRFFSSIGSRQMVMIDGEPRYVVIFATSDLNHELKSVFYVRSIREPIENEGSTVIKIDNEDEKAVMTILLPNKYKINCIPESGNWWRMELMPDPPSLEWCVLYMLSIDSDSLPQVEFIPSGSLMSVKINDKNITFNTDGTIDLLMHDLGQPGKPIHIDF